MLKGAEQRGWWTDVWLDWLTETPWLMNARAMLREIVTDFEVAAFGPRKS